MGEEGCRHSMVERKELWMGVEEIKGEICRQKTTVKEGEKQ